MEKRQGKNKGIRLLKNGRDNHQTDIVRDYLTKFRHVEEELNNWIDAIGEEINWH